ncbi:hypothetical protein HZA55_06510 [Candidatus Poribacteria bacterium]|nr:hypothetical protein [Candidatus Poribacteria bacterium]
MKLKKIFTFFFLLNFLSILNLYAASWQATKYADQLIDTRDEFSISAASYNPALPYPGMGVAYGGNTGLYYSYYDTSKSNWNITSVDTGDSIGRDVSLQIDIDGNPHISYINWNEQFLKYAYKDNEGWHIQILDKDPMVGRFSKLQLDKNKYPHIAYYDAKNGALKYMFFNGSLWKKEIIDIHDEKMVGLYISFKIDKSDNRHISYFDATDDDLKYAYYNGTNWQIEVVDSTDITGLYTYLALDKNNKPYISYYGNGVLKLAYKNELGNWKIEMVDRTFGAGMYISKIIIDEDFTKHLFYFNNESSQTIYAYKKQNLWNYTTITTSNNFDMVLDLNNEIRMFYRSGGIRLLGPEQK